MLDASVAAAEIDDSVERLPSFGMLEQSNSKKNGFLQKIGLKRGDKDLRNTTTGAFSRSTEGGLLSNIKLIEDGRGFHSSELVIKAFKCVGLIESNLSSSNWLPADLTEAKNKLQFT